MKRLLFLMLVLMSISCGCFAQIADDEKYEQARVLYNSEQYAKALPILNELEKKNHAKALNVLGLCYQYGRGVKKDVDKAYKYYMRSAEQGYCYGQRNLAWLYTDDTYMELHPHAPDYKQMELWLRKAAKQDADIMYELARFYLDCSFMDEWQNKDYNAYFKRALEGGSPNAQACASIDCLKDNRYDDALKLLQSAKAKGINTFVPFIYAQETEASVDVLIMICKYLKQHRELKIGECYWDLGNNVLILALNNDVKKTAIELSKTGNVVSKLNLEIEVGGVYIYDEVQESTPYIIFKYREDEKCKVVFLDKHIQLNIVDNVYQFQQRHKEYNVEQALYNGGDNIYLIAKSGKENHTYLKISRTGKVVKTASHSDILTYDLEGSQFELEAWRDHLSYLSKDINLDVLFTLLNFRAANTEYEHEDAVYVDNNCLLVSITEKKEGWGAKSGWLKLSSTGKILGKTPLLERGIIYYNNDKKLFFYNPHIDGGEVSEFGLEEMLKRFK